MKILHTEASTGWGGQDMRVLWEAKAMQERGHLVVIACAPGCPLWQAAQSENIPTEAVEFGRKIKWSAVRKVRQIIRRNDIGIVNTHSSADGWSGAVAAKLSGRICVRTRHLSRRVRPNKPNQILYTKLTDFVITTGEALREQLIRENGLEPSRVASVPTGVDLEYFDPQRWPRENFRQEIGVQNDDFLWGMVAMIRRMKGHDVLADAAALLLQKQPKARFAIVGDVPTDSPVRAAFEAKLEEHGIADRFTMTGFRDDIPNILAGCNAAVLPSVEGEGVPQAIMQAQAMGKPVVATNVGATGEIVRENETGWLVPPSDAKALATAMQRVMDERDEAARRANQAQKLIQTQYSLQAMTDRVEEIYQSLLETKGRR
jgi:glycosyltransferase involved in cell wall biosynthesis